MSRNRIPAVASAAVGVLSVGYAVGYLVVTPKVQHGTDLDAAYRSYLAHPAGPRIAALCLLLSGPLTTLVYAGLHRLLGRLPGGADGSWRTWALALGTVCGVATAAHGLTNLIDTDRLARAYVHGDAATRAAAAVAGGTTLPVDPRGLATFGLVGLVVFAFARLLRDDSPRLAVLGQVLGVDMVLLFLSSAFAAGVPILITGGLASVVLGPAWWFAVAVRLSRGGRTAVSAPAPAGTAVR